MKMLFIFHPHLLDVDCHKCVCIKVFQYFIYEEVSMLESCILHTKTRQCQGIYNYNQLKFLFGIYDALTY